MFNNGINRTISGVQKQNQQNQMTVMWEYDLLIKNDILRGPGYSGHK